MNNDRKELLKKILSKYGVLIAFIILCLVTGFLTPSFFTRTNIINVLRERNVSRREDYKLKVKF